MNELTEATVRLAPFRTGVSTPLRVMIRREDAPQYLCLSRAEYTALCALRDVPVSPREFLARHLTGSHGLQFQQAVHLLMRLTKERFLEDVSEDLAQLVQDFSAKTYGQAESSLRKFSAQCLKVMDFPLISFDRTTVHPVLRRIGLFIGSLPAIILAIIGLVGLVLSTGFWVTPSQVALPELLSAPEELLLKIFVSFSLATSFLSLMQMAALAGAGADFIRGSIRVSGLCVIRLVVNDDDAFMLSKARIARYHMFTLLLPWIFSFLAFQSVHGSSLSSFGGTLAAAFLILAIFMLCPLYRSPLVKMAEGFLATKSVLGRTQNYLASQLLSPLQRRQKQRMDVAYEEKYADAWVVGLVSLAMVWLYGMGIGFADVLLISANDLVVHFQGYDRPFRAGSSAVLLIGLIGAFALPFARLAAIPLQNLWAVAALPLRNARSSLDSFRSSSIPADEAVMAYLQTIAVLAHLGEEDLRSLVSVMRFRNCAIGYDIVKQGEIGDRFFILASGSAQVIIESSTGETVVDVLRPGDTFGEVALLEHGQRTATIRALEGVKVLIVKKVDFDRVFPEQSQMRVDLTRLIRQTKLVADSDALSHLSPRQTRELLLYSESTEAAPGTVLMREGEHGDACYLVEEGTLAVEREGQGVASLTRGALVGAIALIKNSDRTATVTVTEKARLIKIDRESFLNMCMANIFVATLIANLTEEQLAAHAERVS